MKNYRVTVKIQNNLLYKLIMKDYSSVNEFCEKNGFCPSQVGELLNFKKSAYRKDGLPRKFVQGLCDLFYVFPEDIFKEEFESIQKNVCTVEADLEQLALLPDLRTEQLKEGLKNKKALNKALEEILKTLPHREKEVIKLHFGLNCEEKNYKEIAKKFNLTHERIRQIEAKALRRLRHPIRTRKLIEYLSGERKIVLKQRCDEYLKEYRIII